MAAAADFEEGGHVFCVRSRVMLSALAAMLVCACSAGDFRPPITEFDKASTDAVKSFSDFDQSLKQAFLERSVNSVLGTRSLMPSGCNFDSDHCNLVVVRDGAQQAFNADPVDSIRRLMVGVVAYSKSLVVIVTANSEAEIKSATDAAKSNVLNLAKHGDALNASLKGSPLGLEAKVTRFATPIASAVQFGLSRIVEAAKIEALRSATAAMDAIFPDLVTLFNQVAIADLSAKRRDLDKTFRAAWSNYRNDRGSRAKLDALLRTVSLYDQLLQVKPEGVFNNLQQAHAEMTKALNDPNLDYTRVLTFIQRVTDDATQLAEIAKAFRQASKGKTSS